MHINNKADNILCLPIMYYTSVTQRKLKKFENHGAHNSIVIAQGREKLSDLMMVTKTLGELWRSEKRKKIQFSLKWGKILSYLYQYNPIELIWAQMKGKVVVKITDLDNILVQFSIMSQWQIRKNVLIIIYVSRKKIYIRRTQRQNFGI